MNCFTIIYQADKPVLTPHGRWSSIVIRVLNCAGNYNLRGFCDI